MSAWQQCLITSSALFVLCVSPRPCFTKRSSLIMTVECYASFTCGRVTGARDVIIKIAFTVRPIVAVDDMAPATAVRNYCTTAIDGDAGGPHCFCSVASLEVCLYGLSNDSRMIAAGARMWSVNEPPRLRCHCRP